MNPTNPKIKDKIYNYLDSICHIEDKVITINTTVFPNIDNIFGVRNISFHHWATDRVGETYGIIHPDTTMEWFKNGLIHRDNNKPAMTYPDGTMEWWVNGLRHRDNDKPALIHSDTTMEWWVNGLRHRDNDEPAVILADGTSYCYEYGEIVHNNN